MSREKTQLKHIDEYLDKLGAVRAIGNATSSTWGRTHHTINTLKKELNEMKLDFQAIQNSLQYIPSSKLAGDERLFLQRIKEITEKYSTEPVR